MKTTFSPTQFIDISKTHLGNESVHSDHQPQPTQAVVHPTLTEKNPTHEQGGRGSHSNIFAAYDKRQKRKTTNSKEISLNDFYDGISANDKVLLVLGGGTAALTYLAGKKIDSQYTHVVILGEQGLWKTIAHCLAQPHHILALPHEEPATFVNPSKHDEINNILPHQSGSAYAHSHEYQARLSKLEIFIVKLLKKQGKKIHIEREATAQKIFNDGSRYGFTTGKSGEQFFANKVVVASGAAPAKLLPKELRPKATESGHATVGAKQILSYMDILTPGIEEKIRGKDIFIYGGGATSAWAMEVCTMHGKSTAWVGKSGFGNAERAGPRVAAIINGTRDSQTKGIVKYIDYLEPTPGSKEGKVRVHVAHKNKDGSEEIKSFLVDFFVNCIGQEAYEKGGLPHVLSEDIKSELSPIFDRNQVSGKPETTLGFSTKTGDIKIIGAAAASYYDIERGLKPGPPVSDSLPRSGKVPITIGGVVSSVSALTDYMPLSQDATTGEIALTGLSLHVMNATQLATYFTGRYPDAKASKINTAVQEYITERSKTEFGLDDKQMQKFIDSHFWNLDV